MTVSFHPTAAELLIAAQEHIAKNVLPKIEDTKLKFQTLVATHVIGVVARELQAGSHALAHTATAYASLLEGGAAGVDPAIPPAERLAALERALCESIRQGAFDSPDEQSRLLDALRSDTEAALSIWNPAFLARVRKTG